MDIRVPGHYRRTAAKMDQSLGHLDGNGPVSRRLVEYGQVLPLCFGGYGKGLEEVHNLINISSVQSLALNGRIEI